MASSATPPLARRLDSTTILLGTATRGVAQADPRDLDPAALSNVISAALDFTRVAVRALEQQSPPPKDEDEMLVIAHGLQAERFRQVRR